MAKAIYQNLNLEKNDVERVTLSPVGDKLIESVVFEDYQGGVSVKVLVPWQSACEFWRATGKPVCGVKIEGYSVISFAQWKGFCSKGDGVVTTWRVEVGASRCIALSAQIGVPYLQHEEFEKLKAA